MGDFRIPLEIKFKELIDAGPFELESQFEKMATDINFPGSQNVKEIKKEDLEVMKYLDFLEIIKRRNNGRKMAHLTPFLEGYFIQKAGSYLIDEKERDNCFKQAISNYQSFLNTNAKGNNDILYFAQWQIGVLKQLLGYSWPIVEENYLKAMEYETIRAEALREILLHYLMHNEWRIAHIFSSYCKNQFLGKLPPKGKWFINASFYKWKILKYHIPVLLNLRKTEEAEVCLRVLSEQSQLQHFNYSPQELEEIYTFKKTLEKSLPTTKLSVDNT